MDKLLAFCSSLARLHARYDMKVARDDAVMVAVVLPGEYVEVEFFVDGSAEIERFLSQGVDEASDAELESLIEVFRS
jgi:hypothetical protein